MAGSFRNNVETFRLIRPNFCPIKLKRNAPEQKKERKLISYFSLIEADESEQNEQEQKKKKTEKKQKKTIWQCWLSLDINLSIVPSFFFYGTINSNWNTGHYFKRLKTFANTNHKELSHPTTQPPGAKLSCATSFIHRIPLGCSGATLD